MQAKQVTGIRPVIGFLHQAILLLSRVGLLFEGLTSFRDIAVLKVILIVLEEKLRLAMPMLIPKLDAGPSLLAVEAAKLLAQLELWRS
jgi:hypothetical protein